MKLNYRWDKLHPTVAIPYVVFNRKERKGTLLLGSLSEAMFWYTFKTGLLQKVSLASSCLFKSPTTYAAGQHKCLYSRGKMCWGTDECEKQPFQSDICAFDSRADTLFLQKQMTNILNSIFTEQPSHTLRSRWPFFDLSRRFSTAGDSCLTEHQQKLVWNLRPGGTNNMANFVIKCARISFALLLVILD